MSDFDKIPPLFVVPTMAVTGGFSGVFLAAIVFAGAEASRWVWSLFPILIYILYLIVVLGCGTIGFFLNADRSISSGVEAGANAIFYAIFISFSSCVLFGLFRREWSLLDGDSFTGIQDVSRLGWVLFGLDNYFESIFLDAPAIYDVHFAGNIKAASFWPQTSLFTFRLFVDAILVKALFSAWKFYRQEKKASTVDVRE